MLLNQISPSDPITSLVLEGLGQSAPVVKDMQLYSKTGAADSVKRARDGGNASFFRSLNENNTTTGPTPVYDPVTKKIFSFDAKVDVVLEDRNEDVEAELAMQTKLEAIEAGYVLQDKIFNGDSDDDEEEFDGLAQLVQVANVIPIATDGIPASLGNSDANVTNQQKIIEAFLRQAATVIGGASHAYMNEYLKIRLLTIAKNLGYYRLSKDELGATIEQIGDVIIRGAGYSKAGAPLLPFTDTVGNSTNTSPIYFVRWGERIDLTALTSVGVKARYAGQIGNFLINNVNLDMVLHLQNHKALVKSTGWRLE